MKLAQISNAKLTSQIPLLVIISGPTAVGKTQLAIDLAKRYDTVILSADSRQVYKQLHIGVAKPSKSQLAEVEHLLIGHVDITEEYSAGQFERESIEHLGRLFKTKKIVFVSGGTGLYIKALTDGLDQFPETSREKWDSMLKEKGLSFLQEELLRLDPEYHGTVDLNNPRRLVRALSVIEASGIPFSEYLGKKKAERPFRILKIALIRERDELYHRINERVDQMIKEGLVEEARSLEAFKDLPSLQTVGYQELFEHFEGQMTLQEAIDKIKQHTRNYAKRQLTWFRNEGQWHFYSPEDPIDIINLIKRTL